MHPKGTAELEASGRLSGSGVLGNTIGNPLETTIALSHLIFEGTLDRYAGQFQTAADEFERFFHPRADNPVQKGARDMVRIVRLFFADQRYIDEFALVGR